MHPSGVQYGLSLGLLEFCGRHVVVSDLLFESISKIVRRKIRGRNRLTGTDTWTFFIREGLGRVRHQFSGKSRETTPFFMGLDGVVETSLIGIAEKTRIGRGLARSVLPSDEFQHELNRRVRHLELSEDMVKNHRFLFRICYGIVKDFCLRFDPESLPHAELLAVCIYEVLHRARCLEITVFFQRANKRFELQRSCPIAGRRHFFRVHPASCGS